MSPSKPRLSFWLPESVSLRITILTAFLLIYVPAVGLVIFYNHVANRERAEAEAVRSVELMAARIVERQQLFYGPAADVAAVLGRRMGETPSPVREAPRNLPGALEVLARHPQFYSVNVGTASGELFHVSRVLAGGSYGLPAEEIPKDAEYNAWLISGTPGAMEQRIFFDRQFRPVLTRAVRPSGLIPFQRPWYLAAQQDPGIAVEGPFLFATGQRLGVTFSQRLSGSGQGAVAVSVLLDDFAGFLRRNRVGAHGSSLIFNRQRQVVAVGEPGGKATADSRHVTEGRAMPSLADSAVPSLSELDRYVPPREARTWLRYAVNGEPHAALVVQLPEPFKGDLYLAVVVALDDFLAPIARDTAVTALISMAIGAAAVPLIFWLAVQISRPVLRLAEESRRLARLEFGHTTKTRSMIAEVRKLFDAFAAMKVGLGAFTKFVPRSVVEDLLESRQEPVPGGEARTISILFTDVQDFTRLAEGMPPRDLFRKATSYYGEVGAPILVSGGVIGRFMGDGIVAYWNAPQPDPDHMSKAAQSALESRARSEALNRRWESFGWPIMRTRYGLHVGEAMIGNIGLPDRLEYNAIGDSLNLASRLEALNKVYGTQILVSDAMLDRLPGDFVARRVDLVLPSGTSVPLGISELIGRVGGPEEIVPTDARIELADLWNRRVIPAYRAQDWSGALASIRDCLQREPADPLARLYAARCQAYLAHPPPAGWNGVVQYTEK